MLTSVLQGFGGSSIVLQAAQLAFIADSSTTTSRSFYFGLALLTPLIGSPITVFVSLSKVGEGANQGHLAPFIVAAIGCWVAYHLYLTFILREARFVDGSFDRDIDQESHAIPVEATTSIPDVDAILGQPATCLNQFLTLSSSFSETAPYVGSPPLRSSYLSQEVCPD